MTAHPRWPSSSEDDALGLTALTRQAVGASATASTDVAVLYIPVGIVDKLVKTRPASPATSARRSTTAAGHRSRRSRNAGLAPPAGSSLVAYR